MQIVEKVVKKNRILLIRIKRIVHLIKSSCENYVENNWNLLGTVIF